MYKTALAIGALALVAFPLQQGPSQWLYPTSHRGIYPLKEEALTIEYTYTTDEAALRVEAESESTLAGVEVVDPTGDLIFSVSAGNVGVGSLSGFTLESGETDIHTLLRRYAAGPHQIRAWTTNGVLLQGSAELSHEFLRPPVILSPVEGEQNVPADALVVHWVADPQADGYRIALEQGDTDGIVVLLPPGQDSFVVPPGVLAAGTESYLEVGVLADSGNSTVVELSFTTR